MYVSMNEFPELAEVPGEAWSTRFIRVMNNFHLRFPTVSDPPGYYRKITEKQNGMDRTYAERFGPLEDWNRGKDEGSLTSSLHWHQTGREYYTELDCTVVEEGGNLSAIAAGIDAFEAQRDADTEAAYEALWHLLLPIYIGMRKKGYTSYDLHS
jgi:hypothetical protein